MVYDITPAISEQLGVWPGDTPMSREILADMKQGAHMTLSTLRATVHLGAHADAPSHYGKNAPAIDERSLDFFVGTCQVISVDVPRATRIEPSDVAWPIKAPRVLFCTKTYPDPHAPNEDFVAPSADLVDRLASEGVRTVGIDTPSMDLFHSKDLPTHQACLRHDLAILEGLVLAEVPDGLYELIALPLKLVGFDGSPVRAILRTQEGT